METVWQRLRLHLPVLLVAFGITVYIIIGYCVHLGEQAAQGFSFDWLSPWNWRTVLDGGFYFAKHVPHLGVATLLSFLYYVAALVRNRAFFRILSCFAAFYLLVVLAGNLYTIVTPAHGLPGWFWAFEGAELFHCLFKAFSLPFAPNLFLYFFAPITSMLTIAGVLFMALDGWRLSRARKVIHLSAYGLHGGFSWRERLLPHWPILLLGLTMLYYGVDGIITAFTWTGGNPSLSHWAERIAQYFDLRMGSFLPLFAVVLIYSISLLLQKRTFHGIAALLGLGYLAAIIYGNFEYARYHFVTTDPMYFFHQYFKGSDIAVYTYLFLPFRLDSFPLSWLADIFVCLFAVISVAAMTIISLRHTFRRNSSETLWR